MNEGTRPGYMFMHADQVLLQSTRCTTTSSPQRAVTTLCVSCCIARGDSRQLCTSTSSNRLWDMNPGTVVVGKGR